MSNLFLLISETPFRHQGQYHDEETDLYYNRFRYYDPKLGQYMTQDPIGLAGNNPTLYGYVGDTNWWVDPFGLARVGNISFLERQHPSSLTPDNLGGVWNIPATGNRHQDRLDFLDLLGIDNPGRDWHVHHTSWNPDTNMMQVQLVDASTHMSRSHVGGINDFQQETGTRYGTADAREEAQRRNEENGRGC